MTTAPEPRCELTELVVSQCAHCRPQPAEPGREIAYRFEAGYDGTCGICDEPFEAGERIGRVDGENLYACPSCCRDLT
jgi:hypothetical protein